MVQGSTSVLYCPFMKTLLPAFTAVKRESSNTRRLAACLIISYFLMYFNLSKTPTKLENLSNYRVSLEEIAFKKKLFAATSLCKIDKEKKSELCATAASASNFKKDFSLLSSLGK